MNDKPIVSNWIDPDDAPQLTADWFHEADKWDSKTLVRRGRPLSDSPKQAVSLRLDKDLLEWFRKTGTGWQTRINDELRKAAGL